MNPHLAPPLDFVLVQVVLCEVVLRVVEVRVVPRVRGVRGWRDPQLTKNGVYRALVHVLPCAASGRCWWGRTHPLLCNHSVDLIDGVLDALPQLFVKLPRGTGGRLLLRLRCLLLQGLSHLVYGGLVHIVWPGIHLVDDVLIHVVLHLVYGVLIHVVLHLVLHLVDGVLIHVVVFHGHTQVYVATTAVVAFLRRNEALGGAGPPLAFILALVITAHVGEELLVHILLVHIVVVLVGR